MKLKKEEIEAKTWKIEEIFQDIEGDSENVKMTIPSEIAEYLGLEEGGEVRIQTTENGLIITKIG